MNPKKLSQKECRKSINFSQASNNTSKPYNAVLPRTYLNKGGKPIRTLEWANFQNRQGQDSVDSIVLVKANPF